MSEGASPANDSGAHPSRRVLGARVGAAISLFALLSSLVYLGSYAPSTPARQAVGTTTPSTAPPTTAANVIPSSTTTTPTTLATTTTAPPSPPSNTADIIYQGQGMILLATAPYVNYSPGQTPPTSPLPHLYKTTDGTHWSDITPPLAKTPGFGYPGFSGASFISPSTGWVTTWNVSNLAVTIYKTDNGGASWTSMPGGQQDQHSGAANLVDLITPNIAYQETMDPAAPFDKISVTTNAGASWTSVYNGDVPLQPGQVPAGPSQLPIAFSSTSNGFAADGLPSAAPWAEGPHFFHTTDGGRTWTAESPPLPLPNADCRSSKNPDSLTGCAYGLPQFSNQSGWNLPAVSFSGDSASIVFDRTTNGGANWTKGLTTIDLPTNPQHESTVVGYAARLPLVSIPPGGSMWALGWKNSEIVTANYVGPGSNWHTNTITNPGFAPTGFAALNARVAFMTTQTLSSTNAIPGLLETTDEGQSWHAIQPPY